MLGRMEIPGRGPGTVKEHSVWSAERLGFSEGVGGAPLKSNPSSSAPSLGLGARDSPPYPLGKKGEHSSTFLMGL